MPVVAVVVALVLLAVAVVLFLAPRTRDAAPGADEASRPSWAPPAGSPPRTMNPFDGVSVVTLVDPTWLDETAKATGIPRRALAAYAGATVVKEDHRPDCHLDWTTLAAIGAVESDHGRHGGSTVNDAGDVEPPIYGRDLDGEGVALIPDSDGGEIDEDAEGDRAVGPMQFIPESWRNWHVDGNADGVQDPQNIDDAVMAAGNYLCRASSAFDTEEGWRAGVMAYNSDPDYVGTVAAYAVRFAEAAAASATTPSP